MSGETKALRNTRNQVYTLHLEKLLRLTGLFPSIGTTVKPNTIARILEETGSVQGVNSDILTTTRNL